MKYTIYDNKLNPHHKEFKSDAECLNYLKTHYYDYIYSITSSDSIVVTRPNGYILAYINTATGEQTIKIWKGTI